MAFALTLRGLDDWTRKFFDESWVLRGQAGLLEEIQSTVDNVVLSSERLAAMTIPEIRRLGEMFKDFEIQIVIVRRDLQSYLRSMWRHAVFYHDCGETLETFLSRFQNFSFGKAEVKFSEYFAVHTYDLDAPDYAQKMGELLGTTLNIPRANVGVPFELARHLQLTHSLLGSVEFKRRFDAETKNRMLDVWNCRAAVEIDPVDAAIF